MSSIELGFNAEARKALADFIEAKAQMKRAEAQKEEAEAKLRNFLGEATLATVGGVPAYRIEFRNREGVDTRALATAYPELYDEFRTNTSYTFIRAI